MTSIIFSASSWEEFTITFQFALKKVRGMMALLALLMFIMFPMILMVAMSNIQNNMRHAATLDMLDSSYRDYISFIIVFVMPLLLVFTVVIAVMLFSYLHRKRSIDLFHALPIRRTPALLGRYFAGLTALFVPILLNFLIVAVIGVSYNISMQCSFYFIFNRLFWTMLMVAAALTFSVFMAVCTGTSFDMVLSILGVNVAYPLLIYVSDVLASRILPGLQVTVTPTSTLLTACSPFSAAFLPVFNFVLGRDSVKGVSGGFLIWWILCTLFLLGGSILLCRKRKSECAENNFAFPIPKIIIRFMVTAVSGIGFGLLLFLSTNMPTSFFIGVVSGSLAAHIVVEAVYSRGFQQMRKSFLWYGVFAASFLAFYAVLATGFFGYDTRVPNAAEVQSISVTAPNSMADNRFYSTNEDTNEDYSIRKIGELSPSIRERENIEKVLAVHRAFTEANRNKRFPYNLKGRDYDNFILTYHLKNGRTVIRSYPYSNTVSDLKETVKQITAIPEYHQTASVLFYLEPEYIDGIRIRMISKSQTPRRSAKELEPVLNFEEKRELLESLKKDCLNGAINYNFNPSSEENDYIEVNLEYKNAVKLKEGPLKTLLGGYDGKIDINGTDSFDLYSNAAHTREVIEKKGWCKTASTE